MEETGQYPALITEIVELDLINSAIPGAILIVGSDANFTIQQANQGYFDLIGFTREEVAAQFYNQAVRTIHPADLEDSLRSFMTQVQTQPDAPFHIKARLVHRQDGYRFVHFSGRYNQADESFCFLLVDISEQQEALEQLQRERDFNALVASLSEDAFFDCDILAGTMRYSPNFSAKFGLPEQVLQYPQELLERGLIAAESQHLYEQRFLRTEEGIIEEELHLSAPHDGPLCYLCRYQVFHDSLGIPTRAVGKLRDITAQKQHLLELSRKAERDPLTGIFNKRATELLIIDRLERSKPDERHALLLIDVDNFKEVNDRLGHLYGDVVLTQLADGLRRLFRAEDVIGRIGGDEFFVFLPGGERGELLNSRTQQVCDLFRQTFQDKQESVHISASVGIACWPMHGEDFFSIYRHADRALYTVKQRGKDGFFVYDGMESRAYESCRTEIDSRGTQKNFAANRPEYIFKLLYEAKDVPAVIRLVLKLFGEHFSYSRAYIAEYSEDGTRVSNTFEWCAVGITSEIEGLQNLPMQLGKTIDLALRTQGRFVMRTLDDLPENGERELLAKQGIHSMLCFAIESEDQPVGFIGFDDCTGERYPSTPEIDELAVICQMLATFLLRLRAFERVERQSQRLAALLDRLEGEVCVIDPKTHQILYENAEAKAQGLARTPDLRCYEVYAGRSSPCEDCPLTQLTQEVELVHSPVRHGAGVARRASAAYIEWDKNARACLVSIPHKDAEKVP